MWYEYIGEFLTGKLVILKQCFSFLLTKNFNFNDGSNFSIPEIISGVRNLVFINFSSHPSYFQAFFLTLRAPPRMGATFSKTNEFLFQQEILSPLRPKSYETG